MRANFYTAIRSGLGPLKQGQVNGIEAILDAFAAEPGLPIEHAAYMLATAWHETGERMQAIRETFAASDAAAIRILENAWKRGQLPWVSRPYWRKDKRGLSWLGRGLVQITHESNYRKADALLGGVGLADDPSLALKMPIAIQIMLKGMQAGLFRRRALGDYALGDYVPMRDIINGDTTKPLRRGQKLTMGQMIAGYAETFERALRAAYPDGVIR